MVNRNVISLHIPNPAHSMGDAVPRCIDTSDILELNLESDRRLLVTDGQLWVTIQNDPNDYILDAHRAMNIPNRKLVLVEAEKPSCFQLD
ncbi:MAG TPA: DUF2917 domain-containing protein [Rectinemataceae bacterium]|nr:DUF2917 domain-containing protein [Rectinemataceae bacterium]